MIKTNREVVTLQGRFDQQRVKLIHVEEDVVGFHGVMLGGRFRGTFKHEFYKKMRGVR